MSKKEEILLMIFISHNYLDKELIEEIAQKLSSIYGQNNVFYDKWSIQPGDGIIDKMNTGLDNCRFFFFFVSKNSLQSNMVKLEWQAALLKATKGNAKFIPVRIDDCSFPIIFMQILYIDIYEQGIDIGIRQMIDVINGNNTFRPNDKFQNVKSYIEVGSDYVIIEFIPQFYMEPISKYAIILDNKENEISWEVLSESAFDSSMNENMIELNNKKMNFLYIGLDRTTTPSCPVQVKITQKTNKPINIVGAMKGKNSQINSFDLIPLIKK